MHLAARPAPHHRRPRVPALAAIGTAAVLVACSEPFPEAPSPAQSFDTTQERAEGPPGPDNTGVPAGTALRRSDSLTISEDGAVVENLDIDGCVVVDADDVTIRRTRITCTDAPGGRAVVMDGKHTGLLIEDVEVDGGGTTEIGIDLNEAVIRRANIHSVNDGIRMGADLVIEDSWIHTMTRQGDLHPDAIQGISARDVVIRRNTLDPRNAKTGDLGNAAIMLGSETGPKISRGVVIEDNHLDGGNYTINISAAITAKDFVVRGNVFGPNARYGPVLTRTDVPVGEGNVMAETDEPIDVDTKDD